MKRHLRSRFPGTQLFHEALPDLPADVKAWRPSKITAIAYSRRQFAAADGQKIDLVVTLGGDGTVLRVSSLFSTGLVPPVLSFSMGTLGFLLPFRVF